MVEFIALKKDRLFICCLLERRESCRSFWLFFFLNFFKVSKNLFLVLCVVCKIPASFKAWFLKIPSFSSLFPAGNTWAVQSTPHFSFPPWVYCHALKKKTKKPRILRISQWKWIAGLFIGSFFILALWGSLWQQGEGDNQFPFYCCCFSSLFFFPSVLPDHLSAFWL